MRLAPSWRHGKRKVNGKPRYNLNEVAEHLGLPMVSVRGVIAARVRAGDPPPEAGRDMSKRTCKVAYHLDEFLVWWNRRN